MKKRSNLIPLGLLCVSLLATSCNSSRKPKSDSAAKKLEQSQAKEKANKAAAESKAIQEKSEELAAEIILSMDEDMARMQDELTEKILAKIELQVIDVDLDMEAAMEANNKKMDESLAARVDSIMKKELDNLSHLSPSEYTTKMSIEAVNARNLENLNRDLDEGINAQVAVSLDLEQAKMQKEIELNQNIAEVADAIEANEDEKASTLVADIVTGQIVDQIIEDGIATAELEKDLKAEICDQADNCSK